VTAALHHDDGRREQQLLDVRAELKRVLRDHLKLAADQHSDEKDERIAELVHKLELLWISLKFKQPSQAPKKSQRQQKRQRPRKVHANIAAAIISDGIQKITGNKKWRGLEPLVRKIFQVLEIHADARAMIAAAEVLKEGGMQIREDTKITPRAHSVEDFFNAMKQKEERRQELRKVAERARELIKKKSVAPG
jgi:hypothetical protein